MGFDSMGEVPESFLSRSVITERLSASQCMNYAKVHGAVPTQTEICQSSSKIINFIDLAGHEKYLRTTLFGLTGHAPDFAMLTVGSNMGVVGMTKVVYCFSLHKPF